tara:strand:- start:2662 stop:3117 length:456 start_codon:yes stop_codon:yes gene_type:complete
MATIVNGTNMVVSIDESASPGAGGLTAVAAATSCTLSLTVDAPEITDKDSGDRKEFAGLSTNWTVDAEVFYNEDGTVNPETLFPAAYGDANASQNGEAQYPRVVYVRFTGNNNYYQGQGYITSISASGGTEDAGTYSVSIQGTGALTQTIV